MTVIALTGRGGGKMRELLDRNRRAHLRAARTHRAHPGSAHPRAALPVRRGRPATAGRTGKHMTRSLHAPSHRLRAGRRCRPPRLIAACAPLLRRRRRRRRLADGDRPPHLGRAARRPGHRAEGDDARARGRRRPRPRQRHQLQPHRAAHRRGGRPRPTRPPSSRRWPRIDNVRTVVNELVVTGSVLAEQPLERRHPDEQGQGELRRRQGRVRQRLQGRHRARHRLPDGPRHRARSRTAPPTSRAASAACRRWCACSR